MGTRAAANQIARFLMGRRAVLPTSITDAWASMILRDPIPNLIGRARQMLRLPYQPPAF